MNITSILRFITPLRVRKYLFKRYADKMLQEAIDKAEAMYRQDGHRYFVLPCKNGSLKVTNIDTETRDGSRIKDKRLLKKSVRKPYQLRKEAFYFTASDICKKKYNPNGMMDWEFEAGRDLYYDWFFSRH